MAFASVILAAAGEGRRLGAPVRKALLPLAGRTLVDRSLDLFAPLSEVREIIVALHAEDLASLEGGADRWLAERRALKLRAVVKGGATRAESVRNAMAAVSPEAEVVAVHDAARPLTSASVIRRVLASAREKGAAVAAAPVTDTLKRVSSEGRILETVPRAGLFGAQTPQAFRRELLVRALEGGPVSTATDDAALVERTGAPVFVVACEEPNLKITTPWDLALAESILARSAGVGAKSVRIGIGNDVHRLESGGPLVLGGLDLPSDRRAVGHSDADVLLHSITDAILGAAGLSDIGTLFPDTDPRWRGARSGLFVREALTLAAACGLVLEQIDAVVSLESPKLSPHRAALRAGLADLLKIDGSCVGIKFKTAEGLGAVGERLAITAEAVVLMGVRSPSPGGSP